MTSQTSPQVAAEATRKILGCYDAITASDPQQFTAALVATLSIFPPAVVAKAASPVHGLAAHIAYPNLAKMRKWLDEEADKYWTEHDKIQRSNRKALPEPVVDPEERQRVYEGLKKLSSDLAKGILPQSMPGS